MKLNIFALFILFTTACQSATPVFDSAGAKRITFRGKSFDLYVVEPKKSEIVFFWKNNKGEIYRNFGNIISEMNLQKKKLIFATNAGMYNPNYQPVGLYIENYKELVKLKKTESKPPKTNKTVSNFAMFPNGVFLIDSNKNAKIVKSFEFTNSNKTVKYATQSGPMLVFDNQINPLFSKTGTSLYIRNGVGVINSTKVVFVISNQEVNFYDFASLFKEYFGCENALYLDGAISETYLPQIGRMNNYGDFGAIIGVIDR